jgi:hypothetical protein
MKRCSACGKHKRLEDFARNPSRVDGLRSNCRECANESSRARYAKDEAYRERAKQNSRKHAKPYSTWDEKTKIKVNENKRIGRICAKPGYKAQKHDEHVIEWSAWKKRVRHERWLSRVPKSEEERAQKRRDRDNRKTELLTDHYIKRRLKKNMPSLKGVSLPKSLIDLERVRLMIVREIKSRNQ